MFLLLIGVLITGLSCAAGSAVAECEALVDAYCRKFDECVGELVPDWESSHHQRCLEDADRLVACEDAGSVGPSYDRCLAELESGPCLPPSDYYDFAAPPSCIGVIQLE